MQRGIGLSVALLALVTGASGDDKKASQEQPKVLKDTVKGSIHHGSGGSLSPIIGKVKVIDANTLTLGDVDFDATEANSPYLFRVEASADAAAGEVYLDVRRRTAEEADLIAAEAGIFDAFYGALGSNPDLLDAFISQSGREEFIDLYEQLLPEHSGGPLLSLSGGVDAVTRALVGRNASAAPGHRRGRQLGVRRWKS